MAWHIRNVLIARVSCETPLRYNSCFDSQKPALRTLPDAPKQPDRQKSETLDVMNFAESCQVKPKETMHLGSFLLVQLANIFKLDSSKPSFSRTRERRELIFESEL